MLIIFLRSGRDSPPALLIRSALSLQFWISYYQVEREYVHSSRTLPLNLTDVGQTIPSTAKIVFIQVSTVYSLQKDIYPISLRSLMKKGRYLVVHFGGCT